MEGMVGEPFPFFIKFNLKEKMRNVKNKWKRLRIKIPYKYFMYYV